MPDNVIIRCLHCGTKNRIPHKKLQGRSVCGKCGASLDELIIPCLKCGTKNRMHEDRLNQKPLCGKCHEPLVISQQKITAFEVTDNTFTREVLTSDTSVLVDCWAPWCAPCRTLSPIIDELASDYANGVKVVKLNVDENQQTSMKYRIMSIPTMLVFKNGVLIDQFVGAMPKDMIIQKLKPHL